MSNLQAAVRRRLNPILLLLLAGGYLVIVGELFIYQHWDGVQFIGFAASVIGLIAVLLGLFVKGGLRIGLAILLAVLSLSGLIGAFQHLESSGEGAIPALAATSAGANMLVAYQPGAALERSALQEGEEDESRESGEGGEETPPPLAPLSLAGLSLMGAAILLAKEE
jgi:hypothetical protein